MEVVLYQPQIPQNTGNIARTCALTGTRLTLVGPLGFSLSKRQLKRAGLDYWEQLQLNQVQSLEEVLAGSFYFFSSKAQRCYSKVSYTPNTTLIFGSETAGLPETYHNKYPNHFVTLPMKTGRCLNLSNAVAISLYEAWRQLGFAWQ